MYRRFRFEPTREMVNMKDSMDVLNALFGAATCETVPTTLMPRVDMKQNADALEVKATMPGVNADDIEISVVDDVLTIKAEVKSESENSSDENEKEATYLIREHSWNSWYREIALPVSVQADKAEAKYENGVLELTLPKAEEEKPKLIAVNKGI